MLLNLEVFTFLSISTALGVPFINKFLLQTLTPPIFSAAIFLPGFVNMPSGKRRCGRGTKADCLARPAGATQMTILILQLMYPKLCTRTFQSFRCIDLGDRIGLLLEADFSSAVSRASTPYVPVAFSIVGTSWAFRCSRLWSFGPTEGLAQP